MSSQPFWYNGSFQESDQLSIPVDEPGLLYGATIFTTLRVYGASLDHPLSNWLGHCRRLRDSAQALQWRSPNWEQIRQGCERLLGFFPVLRITVFPDGREWITGRSLPADLSLRQQQGVVAWLSDSADFRRSLPEHKTGNYLAPWRALQLARDRGAQEAILTNGKGHWLETSTGNLWGWRDGYWWTPPLSAGILPGLVRSQLITWLVRQNKTVGSAPWSEELVAEFEAIAYTNSVVEIVPIHAILRDSTPLAFDPNHDGLQELRDLFQQALLAES